MVYLTPVSLAASAGSGGSAGEKSPLEEAPLRREHPCGICWTIGAGNTIHRGRGIVVPESSWAARLGIHRRGHRLQPGTSELCRLSGSVPDRNEESPVPAAQPQHPNPAPGRAVTSWRFNGWRGRAWTQRAGGGSAPIAAGHGWNRGSAPALRAISEGSHWQSFPAVLGVCRGMNSLASGTGGLPGSGCLGLRREVF